MVEDGSSLSMFIVLLSFWSGEVDERSKGG